MEIAPAVDSPIAPYCEAFVRDPYPTYAWFREHAPVAQAAPWQLNISRRAVDPIAWGTFVQDRRQ
jgi:hypothetical protein